MISTQLQMLISSKCPGVVDKVKVTSASEPSAAQQKQEMDKQHTWDLFKIVISVYFFSSVATNSCSFRSAAVVTPPVETVASSESSAEDHDIKEMTPAVIEATVKEAPTPVVVQPPHTSPKPSFASEVRVRGKPLNSKRNKESFCMYPYNLGVWQGLLRIILLEAQSLIAKDNMMGGMVKGKSDPYAKVSVGEFTFKSSVIKENLNPVWNEMHEVRKKESLRSNSVKALLLFFFFLNWTVSLGGAETWVRTGASESRAVWQRCGQRWLPGQVAKFSNGAATGGFMYWLNIIFTWPAVFLTWQS